MQGGETKGEAGNEVDAVSPHQRHTRSRRVRESGYVYFVRATTLGLIKIGKARCARTRLVNLQIGSPDRLELMGVMLVDDWRKAERRLHR